MANLNEQISKIRWEYAGDALDVTTVLKEPHLQFEEWMLQYIATKPHDPNVMTLATADKYARPSARVVLLRDFSEKGFTFFTNYNSKKGKEIDENPHASILFYWSELSRQVRIDGELEKVSPDVSAAYFKERPFANKISAWVSPQSAEVESKEVLTKNFDSFKNKFEGKEMPCPEFWGGYILRPYRYEFWQGQANRLHDRIQYEYNNEENCWKIVRLAP